jgi:hypothetical protein
MHPVLWKALVAVALGAAAVVLYRRTFPPVLALRRAVLAAMRIGAFALLALLLINPVFVSKTIEVRKPLVLVLVDRSRSMGIDDAAGRTRLDDALRRLEGLRGALGGARAEIEVVPFAEGLASAPLPADSAIAADGEGTDIRGALEAARKRYRGRNLAAIVLLTDGRVTRGMISAGESPGVPVYAVGFGDTLGGADVSVDEVVADRVAYRGTKVPVEAVIRASGVRGAPIVVRLLEGDRVRDSAVLSAKKDDEIIGVSLSYAADAEGERRLTVEATPVAGEDRRENNAESFRLDVLKERVRILYIDQYPDWNATFVRDLVKGSKRFELETVSGVAGAGLRIDPGGRSWIFPATASGLARYDLVIVSDDAKLFDVGANAAALDAFVRAGGSVLFIADENSPLARASSLGLLQPLLSVRRVSGPRIEYGEAAVRLSAVRLSAEGVGDPVVSSLADDGGLDRLPPLAARITGLAAASGSRVPLVLEDRGGGSPFLAFQRRGEGLSAAMLGFPLWRWRLAGGEGRSVYEAFFGGLVQSLAEGGRTIALSIDSDRSVYRRGDRVKLAVSVGNRRAPDGIRGEVRKSGGDGGVSVAAIVFEPDPRRRGHWRASLDPLPPGDYTVTVSAEGDAAAGVTGGTSFSVTDVSVELLDPSRDGPLLVAIAKETGGAYLEGDGLEAFASGLRFSERRVERGDVRGVRGNAVVLAGIVLLLGAEWILRKAWGLV